jgi:DHA1 family bicyclomycin/chloramphenicol resistance-like MFS transporter
MGRSVARDYWSLLRDRRFLVSALTGCLVGAAMFAWVSGSSFLVQRTFGYSAAVYGPIYAATIAGFVAMSLLSGRLAQRLGSDRLLRIGSLIAAAGGVAGVLLGVSVTLTLGMVLVTVALMALGHGFTLPQSMAASVGPFPQLAATASALFGFLNYLINGVLVAAGGTLLDGRALPLLATIALLTAAGALLYAVAAPRQASR